MKIKLSQSENSPRASVGDSAVIATIVLMLIYLTLTGIIAI